MIRTIFSNKQKGFTLVELLASVVVLVAIGSITVGIITSSLRGTNKTNTIENVRQNGNYALAQISKDIAYAQTFDGVNTGFSNDGQTYVANCSFNTPKYITIRIVRSANNVTNKYNCNGSILTVNGSSLVGDSVHLQSCSFTCIQTNATDVPIIGISFTLGPRSLNGLAENVATDITFQTSITMRNYEK